MARANREKNKRRQDWLQVDARILGQILAAQNILFVLPNETRIAEYFSQALSSVPGISSCFVCLGNKSAPIGVFHEICLECPTLQKKDDAPILPRDFSCSLAARQDMRLIRLETNEQTFGFFIFQTDASNAFEPYWPFINNLANYVALSLENRMQKHLLEKSRDEMEVRVKERTEELRRMNERFSLATNAARIGVWDWDIRKNELVWDNGMYALYGVKRENFTGAYEAWLKGLHPDDRTSSDQISRRARLGELKYDTEFRVIWPDGSVHYLKAYGQIVNDENGIPLRMTGINFDITERKQSDEALCKSEQEFRTLAENSPDVIVRYDREGRRIYVNPEFERVNRLSAQEVFGKKPVELSTELAPMADVFTEKLMETMISGTITKIDLSWIKDEKPICWFVRAVPEFDSNGKVTGALTIWNDITERKQAEEEIRKLNQELEKRVSERTAQLEATNKELETFAYSVSHDLRAPLRGIDGFSQILLEEYRDKVDEQGKDYLLRVRSASQRMGQLIDDILKLSRVTRSEINIQQVNLSEMFKEIANGLHGIQPERQVEFIIQKGIKAKGDCRLLQIVLENLIGNAWKFTSNHPSARIEFGVQHKNETPAYFVRDDGAGFKMKYAQKLFGPFQRLHTAEEFPGTGIGLATVQRVIHRHGGKVWAEGEEENLLLGKTGGATFYFTLQIDT